MTELTENSNPARSASKTGRPPWYRRKLLIMPSFQLQLIFWNILIAFFIFMVVLYQIAKAMNEMTMMGTNAGFPSDHPYFQFIRELSGNFYLHITTAFFLGMIVSWLVTLFVSHRFAGPIYRVRTYFEGIARGDALRDITFRKGDFLSDFAVTINQALKKVSRPETTQGAPKESSAPPEQN